ncbi:hypothetical protein BY996DRAFT_6563348 [Phakopsora pachyrhizi]|nr:hypothetical protein BY996DRAFT_6563348 [Phakopsora pachyrhizi]
MSLSCSSADGVKLIQKFEIPKLGNLRVSLKSDSTIGILQSSSERPYQEDRTMAGNLHLQSSGLIKSISGQPLVDQGNLISRSKSSIIDGHGGSEASGFLSANLPRLEEEWIKISDLNGRFERLMVVAVLGFVVVEGGPHWLSLGSSSSAQSKEGATDDCSWVRDKSFPDDVIETNGSATAFQGKTRGKRSPILMGVWGMLSSILDVQTATMGLEKCQERDFELDVESTGQGDLIGAAGSIKRTGTCQIKETRDLSNQKEDEFEDKKTLNRHMLLFGLPDQELQKGGPNKNWKSTTDCLKERMDGSDLHPTETSDDSKQEVVVEFDDKLVPIVSQKAFKKLHTLLKKH